MSTASSCPFCSLAASRIVHFNELALVIRDGFPVSRGHTLVIPRRHVGSFFELTGAERASMLALVDVARTALESELHPDGYNIGINDGAAAGQTVPHLHVHLIPRFAGDQPDPRGGIRWIFPARADYWSGREGNGPPT
jgi:diadenosine tetraphosphate (Ap4A) HIT family hydrolase